MKFNYVCAFVYLSQAVWLVIVNAHSVMTEPQNIAPMVSKTIFKFSSVKRRLVHYFSSFSSGL